MSTLKNREPKLDERAIRARLEHPDPVAPPPDLLQALKDDIPHELPAPLGGTSRPPLSRRPALQLAAALALVLAAGLLTVRVREQRNVSPAERPDVEAAPLDAEQLQLRQRPEDAHRIGSGRAGGSDDRDNTDNKDNRVDKKVLDPTGTERGAARSGVKTELRAAEARRDVVATGPRRQVVRGELRRDAPTHSESVSANGFAVANRAAPATPEAKDELVRESVPALSGMPEEESQVVYDQRGAGLGAATSTGDRNERTREVAKQAAAPVLESAETETGAIAARGRMKRKTVGKPAAAGTPEATVIDRVAAAPARPVSARPASDIAPEPPPVRPPEPDTMIFRDAGTRAFTDPAADPLSTFGLDVDTASYTLARSYLERELLPPPASIRLEEWVNAFDYGDPAPRRGAFALTSEGARAPYGSSERYLVRIGVRARDLDELERQPAALTFLIDTSGSMARGGRLELVKRSLYLLLDELRGDDTVALVTYGSRGRVVLPPTRDKVAIRAAVEQLYPQGSTNLEEGLQLAYELASRNHRNGAIDRIVLLSDGVANVGLTEPMALLESIADWAARGIELTAVGVGMGNYNDALLEQLADRGDGAYAYVDSLREARRVFVENLTGTLQTLAADARMQVRFDPAVVARYRLLGYENRDLPDEAFRDPRTDAGEIGYGHRVSALYEVQLRPDVARRAPVLEATLRYRSAETGDFQEVTTVLRRSQLHDTLSRAPASLRLASVVAELAEILKQAPSAERLDRLFRRAQRLVPEFPGRSDVTELVSAIGRARDLARHGAR